MAVDRRVLADPRFLGAAGLLVANDHWWKAAHGNWLTGKLSDVVGLFVAGVLISVLLGGGGRGRMGLLGLGGLFALIKTVPAATATVVTAADGLLPWSNAVVTDPTDLLALPVLLAVAPVVERPVVWWSSRTVRVAGLLIAASAAVATSYEETPGADLTIEDGVIVAVDPYGSVDEGDMGDVPDDDVPRYATEACRPSTPDECFRIRDLAVEASTDGGATWSTVWEVDHTAAATLRADGVSAYRLDELGARDLVVTDIQVVASFDGMGRNTVELGADGRWTPSPESFRRVPRLVLALQAIVLLLATVTFGAIAVRQRRGLPGWLVITFVAGLSLGLAQLILFAAMRSSIGLFPVEIFIVVPLLALLIASGLSLMEPTHLWRSHQPVGRAMLGTLLFAAVLLPPAPLLWWSASGSPSYRTATLVSVVVGTVVALLPVVVGAIYVKPTAPRSTLAAPPPPPGGSQSAGK